MAEYIKREAILEAFDRTEYDISPAYEPDGFSYKLVCRVIDAVPAADVEPVNSGRWVKNVRGDYSIVCSKCGYGFPTEGFAWLECNRTSEEREFSFWITDVKNYCPNCGARMNEEAQHER